MFTSNVRNVRFCKDIEYPKFHKFIGKSYTLYMYGMSRFAEKLISRSLKIQRKIVYIIYLRNVCICRKIECPELREFNRKLCTLFEQNVWICRKIECPNYGNSTGNCVQYMYGMSGFAEKLNVQNCVNSIENCVHYFCTKCLDLQKN